MAPPSVRIASILRGPHLDQAVLLRKLPVLPLAAAFVCGAVTAVALLPQTVTMVVICWLGCVGVLRGWFWLARRQRWHASTLLLWLLVGCCGATWGLAWHGLFPSQDLAWRLGDRPAPLLIEGHVTSPPRPLPGMGRDPKTGDPLRPATELSLRLTRIRDGEAWLPVRGSAIVVVDGSRPPVSAGAVVRVFGRGLRPAVSANPGEYDFREDARMRRCLSVIRCSSAASVEVLREPPWWHLGPLLERVRGQGVSVLWAHMNPQMAAFAEALLLGNREALSSEQTEPFLLTGTIHILAISGLHVGILAWALFRAFRVVPLGRGVALAAVAGLTGSYMLLVHAEVPVVRATLIVWLACLAAWLGRRPVGLNSLAVVALVVMLWQPMAALRTGTQLSFLSTAVLILIATAIASEQRQVDPIARLIEQSRPPWQRRLRSLGRGVWASILVGACVWAVTAPLVARQYHVVSPIAVVLNPLIAPMVAVAMGCGLIALLVGLVWPWLAGFPAAACAAVLELIQMIAERAAALPWGAVWLGGPSLAWLVGWYLAVIVSVLWARQVGLRKVWRWSVPCLCWLAIGLAGWGIASLVPASRGSLEVTVASMQHGLGILVRPPSGEVLVYDAGRLGAPAAARRAMEAVLRDAGVGTIDMLAISHADSDHFNAVTALMERFTVRRLVLAAGFLASRSPEAMRVVDEARQRQIPVVVAAAGDSLAFAAGATLEVLHPLADAEPDGDDNADSLVCLVEACGRRLLLTGDLEGDAVDELLARGVPHCDAMVAPHHGTRSSLPPRLAAAVRPRVVIVSGTGGQSWDEVREAYEQTGPEGRKADVVCTCQSGAIRLQMDAEGMSLARGTSLGWSEPQRLGR